jgi:hypothetical protein
LPSSQGQTGPYSASYAYPTQQPQARQENERQKQTLKEREDRQRKQAELQQVGVYVDVRPINGWGSLDARDLSSAILKQMKVVKACFLKNLTTFTISKIEYVMNDALYKLFNDTKAEFRKFGKSTREMLLFHGTHPQNVDK